MDEFKKELFEMLGMLTGENVENVIKETMNSPEFKKCWASTKPEITIKLKMNSDLRDNKTTVEKISDEAAIPLDRMKEIIDDKDLLSAAELVRLADVFGYEVRLYDKEGNKVC